MSECGSYPGQLVNMADVEMQTAVDNIIILKHTKILVNVEEALPDILVVTYRYESKIFQGVLLDSTKKNLPCGITPSASQLAQVTADPTKPADNVEDDKLLSVAQRFTYFQDKSCNKSYDHSNHNKYLFKRQIRTPSRYKNSHMNIRLRPRQVLCSKCRSICNENSENVDLTKKQRCPDNNSTNNKLEKLVGIPGELSANKSPRPLFSENQSDNQPTLTTHAKESSGSPLIPKVKIPRLQPSEIASALIGNNKKIQIMGNYWVSRPEPEQEQLEGNKDEDGKLYCVVEREVGERMVLRKKRSMGSMEDLWDESELDDSCTPRPTPIIKISFGRQGEGTVLEIPSRRQDCHSHSDLTKAAKRAIKKAKKEQRRKLLEAPSTTVVSSTESTVPSDILYRHRHKRNKVKHKKKHKEERKSKEDSSEIGNYVTNKFCDIPAEEGAAYSDLKEDCLRQKLSIKLSRLSANAYQRCDVTPNSSKSSTSSEVSDDHGEAVPNFPPPETRLLEQSLDSCVTRDGRMMVVGDIVWGKIHGFPWWPGKVLNIKVSPGGEEGTLEPRAHVSWYGSSTSSDMPCEQLCPFLETFKLRYNKKKRGAYKEAIRQATCEAQGAEGGQETPFLPVSVSAW